MDKYLLGIHSILKGLDNIKFYIFQQNPFIGQIFESSQLDSQQVQAYLENQQIGIIINCCNQKIKFELSSIQVYQGQDNKNINYYVCCEQLQKFYQSQPLNKNICIFSDIPEKSYSLLIAYCYYIDVVTEVREEILMEKDLQFCQKVEVQLTNFKEQLDKSFKDGLILRQQINIQSDLTSSYIEQKSSSVCQSDVQLTQKFKLLDTEHQFKSNYPNQQRQLPEQQFQFQQEFNAIDLQSNKDTSQNSVSITDYSHKLIPQPFITKGTIGRNK